MTQKTLPSDVSRCYGFCCNNRDRCLRYTERDTYQASTPFASHLCDKDAEGLEYFIHARKETK